RAGAVAFARKVLTEGRPLKKVRDSDDKVAAARGKPEVFANFRKANARKFRGFMAPEYNIRCIEAAVNEPFEQGMQTEQKLFRVLLDSPESAAQRYTFFAERQIAKIPGLAADTPQIPIKTVGVIGAGTMGGGIAMNFANIGVPVTIVDMSQEALDRGLKVIRGNYERTASRGGISKAQVEERMALLKGSTDMADLGQADLVIEAVFERMDIKKEVFRKLDAVAKPGAILATNTSYLDINEIAAETKRPEFVIGMHFFSPANVMKLLEVVRTNTTSDSVIATVMALGKKIGKIAGLVRVCHGFVANRMMTLRSQQAMKLVLEGPMPWDIDRALYDFGFPMGPFAMADVVGMDVTWDRDHTNGRDVREVLCENGRFGQKTGAGFYEYDENRNSKPSEFTIQVIKDLRVKFNVTPREISDEEIVERLLYPVINEGAKVLEERIALRASDIDIMLQNGYAWPVYRGGPMWWADHIGLDKVLAKMKQFDAQFGEPFKPAPLLEKLAAEGKRFQEL
ncbi:MAG: 3-hydroxyacyl-CoA dehydrogenase, partial [Caulobacteraceae bacterium]|nr:3-hydroxyacyl-CoA dehydrogenase [Caulobacteraceae bacterium]